MDIVSSQLKGGDDMQMDFKICKLKPHLCHWFYKTWINILSMIDIISKWWAQTSMLKTFDNDLKTSYVR